MAELPYKKQDIKIPADFLAAIGAVVCSASKVEREIEDLILVLGKISKRGSYATAIIIRRMSVSQKTRALRDLSCVGLPRDKEDPSLASKVRGLCDTIDRESEHRNNLAHATISYHDAKNPPIKGSEVISYETAIFDPQKGYVTDSVQYDLPFLEGIIDTYSGCSKQIKALLRRIQQSSQRSASR